MPRARFEQQTYELLASLRNGGQLKHLQYLQGPLGATARLDFCHVMSVAFEGPFAVLLEAYQDAAFWDADFAGWIGYRD